MNDINLIFNKQKEFFNLGKTKDINFRIEALKKLKKVIKEKKTRGTGIEQCLKGRKEKRKHTHTKQNKA